MSIPSTRKSTLAKLATIFAIGFVLSLGFCGVDFLAFTAGFGGGTRVPYIFAITGYLELAGMAICAIGLLIVGLIALMQAIYRRFADPQSGDKL